MAFSEKAWAAIKAAGILTCLGCGCEVEFKAVSYQAGELHGYTCTCGAVVHNNMLVGNDPS